MLRSLDRRTKESVDWLASVAPAWKYGYPEVRANGTQKCGVRGLNLGCLGTKGQAEGEWPSARHQRLLSARHKALGRELVQAPREMSWSEHDVRGVWSRRDLVYFRPATGN